MKVRRCVFAHRNVKSYFGDRTEESVLVIQNLQSEDLNREFNCSVRNQRGFDTCRAELQEEGEETQERTARKSTQPLPVTLT